MADEESREAVIVDTVREQFDRDLTLIRELGLKLKYILETHLHADHITGASLLREATGAKVGISKAAEVNCADLMLEDGVELKLGRKTLRAIATPGHTDSCMSYHFENVVLTGDTLFVRDVGRTDFQQGSKERMYESITAKLFRLPDDTYVYPAHDYRGHRVSTIGEEKAHNSKVGKQRKFSEFEAEMNAMKLGQPKKIHIAVPANKTCGRDVPAAT